MGLPEFRFFVEGDEEVFLNQLLKDKFENIEFDIINVGGWTKIPLVKNQFFEVTENEGVNIVIFDADKDFKKRKEEINELFEEHELTAKLFLFPDNEHSGDFETLLENIAVKDHLVLFECFDSYQQCLKSKEKGYLIPNQKTKIYSYLESLGEDPKPKNRNYLTNCWDLNKEALKPLIDYLNKIIS